MSAGYWGYMQHYQFKDVCAILHTKNLPLQPEASQLKCYGKSIINTLGKWPCNVITMASPTSSAFIVINGNQKPLLSGITCIELGLITVHAVCNVTSTKLIEEHHKEFRGLGVNIILI